MGQRKSLGYALDLEAKSVEHVYELVFVTPHYNIVYHMLLDPEEQALAIRSVTVVGEKLPSMVIPIRASTFKNAPAGVLPASRTLQ